MGNHVGLLFLGLLHILIIVATCQQPTLSFPEPSCTCNVGKGKFKDCANKNDAEIWRKHYYTDVGLYGDCLPHVEVNTRKCYRWRLADNCGPENVVKCSLRHREYLTATLDTNAQHSQVKLFSPGFDQKKPGYFNRNFCIYNVSLDCPEELVEIVPTNATTGLSDGEPCRDYLSFHVDSQITPLLELCGTAVGDPAAYRTIQSTSFSAVLWSDHDGADEGRFEINTRCKFPEQPQELTKVSPA